MAKQYIYSRVSTNQQDYSNQTLRLQEMFPNAIVVEERASGVKSRPVLENLVMRLETGDELIVAALDRLGRKTSEILLLVEDLERKGINLRSIRESIDFGSIAGRLVCQILISVSEMERSLIGERTKTALAAKKKLGVVGGRPKKYGDEVVNLIRQLRIEGKTFREIANQTGVSIGRVHQLTRVK